MRNAAGFLPPGAPFYGIPQGSVFAVDGAGLGPAEAVSREASADSPLGRELAAVSIKITAAGGTAVDAILYSVSANRVTAILPAAAPVGNGTVVLTYDGRASAAVPIRIVASAFGFSSVDGSGVGGAAPRIGGVEGDRVAFLNAANPGETLVFEGTGLGADSNDETMPIDGAANLADLPFEVYFGYVKAEVTYRGRSKRPGWDRVDVVVPEGIDGCYTSVYSKTRGDVVSNTVTVAVAPAAAGRVCKEFGFRPTNYEEVFSRSAVNAAWYYLGQFITSIPATGPIPASTTVTDAANAQFVRYDTFQFSNYGGRGEPGYGSCVVTTALGELVVVPIEIKALDAGPSIGLTLPNGNEIRLPKQTPITSYVYSSGPPTRPLFIPAGGGTFKFSAPGGEDVGAHEATIRTTAPVRWTNRSMITAVNRSSNLEITWTGGEEDSYLIIYGASTNGANPPLITSFNCAERTSAGRFVVPRDILASMGPSFAVPGPFSIPTGQLALINYRIPAKFEAQGIDVGNISYYVWDATQVTYQ